MYLLINRKKHTPVHTKNNILTFVKQQVLLVIALCMVFAVSSNAQAVDGWEKFYDIGGTDELNSVIQTRDEGFLAVGYHTAQTPYIIKMDPDGEILWQEDYGQLNPNGQFRAIVEVADGYIAVGTVSDGSGRDVLVVKINDRGEQLWANTYGGTEDDEGLGVTATNDGGIAVVGFQEDQFLEKQVYILKIDAAGTLEWEGTYGNNYDDVGNGIIERADGSLVVAGFTELNVNASVALLLQVDETGTQELYNQIGSATVATDIVETANGFALSGFTNVTGDLRAKLIFTDLDGNFGDVFSFGDPTFVNQFESITTTEDGSFVLAGFSEISPLDIEAYLVKTDSDGTEVWQKTFGRPNTPDFFFDVTTTFNDEFVMVGSHDQSLGGETDYYIAKANAEADIYSNYIIGNIFLDLNNNCDFDGSDEAVEGWIVEAVGDTHSCYGTSDADGNYAILVNNGSYTIQPHFPNNYWNSCIESQTVNFNAPFDTLDLDFAVFVEQPCTDIEIDMTTLGLTPGGASDYLITYCNNGTSTALNGDLYVDVEFDESYTINSSSISFIVLGDGVFRFQNLPELSPFNCGEIIINVTVDGVDGQTHSARAHAFPDEFCPTGSDVALLEVSTACVGDEVELTITNTSSTAISAATDFTIIEDMILLQLPLDPLNPGESEVITRPANGATYRILVDQDAAYVGDSRPSEAIEGCVVGGGTFTTGIVNQLPEDDYDHFLSVDCQENQTTLNNESRGYPKGYDTEHFIQQCADLKYHHRFIYTGPDTAIRVVIRDTLSPFLDPASVRPGGSNHEYTMDVYGCGILSFTFENINLTGGNTNPDESSVFVKYRVSQKLDNAVGSIVDNSAAAYFGYDRRIKTDSIFHTIESCEEEDFIELIVSTTEILLEGVEAIHVYPNPFVDQATVEVVADRELEDLTFKLYDVSGRLLRNESFTGMTHQLHRSGLTSGTYVYKIESKGMPVSVGKLLVN